MNKKGFTVMEMLIVIATITVLAAILLPKVTAMIQKRKALRLYNTTVNLASGLSEFYKDCGTYPTPADIGLLWNKNWATSSGVLSGVDPSTCWQGPYIDSLPPNVQGYFYSPFGTNSICTVITNGKDINNNGNTTDIYVKCTEIPYTVATLLEKKVDGSYQVDFTSGDFLAQCAKGFCTVEIIIDEF